MKIGAKLVNVRMMMPSEIAAEGWEDNHHSESATALIFDDGTVLYASQDDEGNGPGRMFGYNYKKGPSESSFAI